MTLTSVAFGLLAVTAQIGVPVQGGEAERGVIPLGVPVQEAPPGAVGLVLPAGAQEVGGSEAEVALWARGANARAALANAPFADRLGPVEYAWIEETVASLTLRGKVAQLVVAYLEGGRPSEGSARWKRARRLVEAEKVGGFIVGVGASHGTASWLNELQGESELPLLMAADLEWGPGTRLRGATVLPINMAIAAAGAPSLAYEAGRITALESRAAGIHMAFAPVADVNVNPDNPVINTRSYGSDPGDVSTRVVQFIQGARSAGLMTVVKHFPGHGDTETDSHLAMPVLGVDRFRLDAVELAPFRAAIGAGVDGVMTAHLAVPALDPWMTLRPATLSPPILTALLREELSFGGLVVTDALHMDGVKRHGRTGRVAVDAVLAGADILLMPPDEKEAIDAVVEAVRRGQVTEERIDHSVRRVLAAKAAVGLVRGRRVNMGLMLAEVGRGEHEAWAREAAERSITVVRAEAGALPVRVRDRTVVAVIYDDRRNHDAGSELEAALTERGARVVAVRLSKSSDAAALERARRLAESADVTLFASFSRALPWKGALGLEEDVASLARWLGESGAPVISFGDPYLLRQLPTARNYLIAWSEAAVSQRAAARALVGEIPITGTLPIDLPEGHGVGHGILVPSLPGITVLRNP